MQLLGGGSFAKVVIQLFPEITIIVIGGTNDCLIVWIMHPEIIRPVREGLAVKIQLAVKLIFLRGKHWGHHRIHEITTQSLFVFSAELARSPYRLRIAQRGREGKRKA